LRKYSADFQAFADMIFQKVCPGVGCALLFGNVWYALMAAKVATKENRLDVTALPYGVNTPAGFLTVFMVMLPICFKYSPKFGGQLSPDDFAWKSMTGACAANFIGGMFEISGILIGEIVRKNVPRAALFAPICGVGFVWLGFSPLIDVMREPLIGMIPLGLCFTGFFANHGKGIYSNKIPAAVIIFIVGTTLWWAGLAQWDTEGRSGDAGDLNERDKMAAMVRFAAKQYVGKNSWSPFVALSGFNELTSRAVAIQFPIALASFLETIENVEAAALSGDNYNCNEAMLADGCGTMFGALCGSVLPTTVYIGHRRHKITGATSAYSLTNGLVFFVLMMSGLTGLLFYIIDPVSIGVILIAVGLMIVQQSLEASASRHYPALMIGIMFVVADMLYFDHFNFAVGMATRSLGRMRGVSNMAPAGGIMCSLVVTAILCDLTDSRFIRAGIFCTIACVFSLFGLMHGNNYLFLDGSAMHADTGIAGMEDFYTTDLGEVMLSTFVFPKFDYSGIPIPEDPAWGYAINNDEVRRFNEGWRFSTAYAALALFCAGHALHQKATGKVPAIMDNGVSEMHQKIMDGHNLSSKYVPDDAGNVVN
jgi:AGZA family xanthine/uracil permease-like MFS transporter